MHNLLRTEIILLCVGLFFLAGCSTALTSPIAGQAPTVTTSASPTMTVEPTAVSSSGLQVVIFYSPL